ncbi:RNA polymerase factor sigma-54 [Flexibacterium corallicola]|uniref:RNA polymerase factor sigma-54 n=1 Tax=Flexibacterium corallicola TaxID=3037259 RepID=UPI00286F6A49|nr:RNA polymerase factor sigma-54 [Pseudovibrio sp. M1P-2-3]
MALSPKLEVRQSQQLVMTPQLMQAIKLLQMSSLDLVSYVENEIDSNPFLERTEGDTQGEGAERSEPLENAGEKTSADGADGADGDWMASQLETTPAAISSRMDADLSNVFPDDNGVERVVDPSAAKADNWKAPSNGAMASTSEDFNLETFVAAELSMADVLLEQASVALTSPADRMVALYLIDALDENGYLRIDQLEAAEKLGISLEHLEQVILQLQGLDPVGIFARSLEECLALQLREKDRYDPAMQALIENIGLLAKREFEMLKALCGVDDEDLQEMIFEVKQLNPKPGAIFEHELVQPVVPDAIVKQSAHGWTVELNSETLPKVLVNQSYYSEISSAVNGEADQQYFMDSLQTANWLAKSLEQRARTILKVATEIVRQQDRFLSLGVQHLRPLNLRTIADAIGMHESTVSRVTSNKYIATPRGIYELKYFFSSTISSVEGGEGHSSESVKHKIKQLIDAESPKAILSDDTIVKLLKGEGVDIARRTVAKYRDVLKIPSSVQRRREKRISS